LEDLKSCLKLLNTDNPVPYGPLDFDDATQWTTYRASEVSTLSQMMLLMMQTNPGLVQTSDRHSNGDLSARVDSLKLDGPTSGFTFIPPDPRRTYRELLERCLDWDLEVLSTLPEDEDVSLGVLSQEHMTLLRECSVRWRLPARFHAWTFLDAIVAKLEEGTVPPACVHEATALVAKCSAEASVDTWAMSDVSALKSICTNADVQQRGLEMAMARRDACFLLTVDQALATGKNGYHSPDFLEAVTDWLVLGTQDVTASHLAKIAENIVSRIRSQAFESYVSEAGDQLDREGSRTKAFAMAMATWIEKEAKKLNKKFGDPIAEWVWQASMEDELTPVRSTSYHSS